MRFLLFLLIFAGLVFLQIYLSKKENRWIGLMLPIISFVMSFILSFGQIVTHDNVTTSSGGLIIATWLLFNIPTVVFILIYFACREKRRRNKQLEKMNIQDLN